MLAHMSLSRVLIKGDALQLGTWTVTTDPVESNGNPQLRV